MEHVSVIVPAAGQGRRLGGEPKQFRMLGPCSILQHTLRALRQCSSVDSMVVVLPPGHASTGFVDDLKVHAVCEGGTTRQASVAHAMQCLPELAGLVLVHDAVRPFVRAQEVRAVIWAAKETGAAALAVPAIDTLRYAHDGRFTRLVPRDGLYHMQTPQGFRREVLARAVAAADATYTDEVALVQRSGYPVTVVAGSRTNIKITTAADWEWAEAYWRSHGALGVCV